MQGDGAAPEEEAVIVANGQIGGGQILAFGDMLRDEGEDVFSLKSLASKGVPKAPEK